MNFLAHFYHRLAYFIALALVILLGLASRAYAEQLPPFVLWYVGDSLWAVAVFLGLSFLFPAVALPGRVAGALFIAYAVEFSQLYQAEWLNLLRATRLGGLLLGHGFVWSDLLAYAVGIAAAAGVDSFFSRYGVTSTNSIKK